MNEGINEATRPEDPSPNRTVKLEGAPPVVSNEQRPSEPRQVDELVAALGNPKHKAHRTAVDELAAIGAPAVPALNAALAPDRPWLTSYRAAEALAQIGDGRATGALIGALRHPNSNVRWSVVQALAEIGDSRSIMALRRVARDDRGKTSWGEAVSDTAQLALDRLQSRSIFLRFWEPLKTIVFVALAAAAVIWAVNRYNAFREDARTPVAAPEVLTQAEIDATAQAAAAAANPTPTPPPTPPPTPAPPQTISGRVNTNSNFRSGPSRDASVLSLVREGTQVQILGRSGSWFRVRLENNQEGWIALSQVDPPGGANIPEIQP